MANSWAEDNRWEFRGERGIWKKVETEMPGDTEEVRITVQRKAQQATGENVDKYKQINLSYKS